MWLRKSLECQERLAIPFSGFSSQSTLLGLLIQGAANCSWYLAPALPTCLELRGDQAGKLGSWVFEGS